jgi:hypothetical protein
MAGLLAVLSRDALAHPGIPDTWDTGIPAELRA